MSQNNFHNDWLNYSGKANSNSDDFVVDPSSTNFPQIDFPVMINDINPEILSRLCSSIMEIQKQLFPNHPVKYIPIVPGNEITVLNIIFSAFYQLDLSVPGEVEKPFKIHAPNFYLYFKKY